MLLGLVLALLVFGTPAALADGACSDGGVKDFFIQGGQQVLEGGNLKIKSLTQDEEVALSSSSLTCRYLMHLSDRSTRRVRFTYMLNEAGETSIDYEEETERTAR